MEESTKDMKVQDRVGQGDNTPEGVMAETIEVNMTPEYLFDFQLYHTYSKFSGFLSNVLGLAVLFMGIIMWVNDQISLVRFLFFVLAAAVFIGYTPVLLKKRSKEQVKGLERFRCKNTYTFAEDGITVQYADKTEHYAWGRFKRVVTAPKTMGFYYGDNDALIIPKADFNDRFIPIMTMVTGHMPPGSVRFR